MTLMVFVVYLPLYVVAKQPSEMNTAVNYIFDTLLLAGTILFFAQAMPESAGKHAPVAAEGAQALASD
jgi:hypothetical protein